MESTGTTRRDYREMLFRAQGIGSYISGIILFDETLRQQAADGTPLVNVVTGQGIIPGIKVDKGAKDLAQAPGEKVTEGLDGLRERLAEYRDLGAKFTKWRAVIAIGDNIPSVYCIDANAHALARYAAMAQEAGLVPIVEPEVLIDGGHTIEQCYRASEDALQHTFRVLFEHRVHMDGMLLKPNMVLSGKDCPDQASVEQVAELTVKCLKRTVPSAVPGVMFLSGGQTDLDATARLNAMNRLGSLPWRLSFSFSRALQGTPMRLWAGKAENVSPAQATFLHRARMNAAASTGSWTADLED